MPGRLTVGLRIAHDWEIIENAGDGNNRNDEDMERLSEISP